MKTPVPALPNATGAIGIIGDIAALEPIGFSLVAALIGSIKGKSDADLLTQDSATLAQVVADAHAAAGS